MKQITAVVTPGAVEDVKHALERLAILGMTLKEVQGYSSKERRTEVYRGAHHPVDLVPKARIDVLVEDAVADRAVQAVVNAAHTGTAGEDKVWVTPVHTVIRVRTGERDTNAV